MSFNQFYKVNSPPLNRSLLQVYAKYTREFPPPQASKQLEIPSLATCICNFNYFLTPTLLLFTSPFSFVKKKLIFPPLSCSPCNLDLPPLI